MRKIYVLFMICLLLTSCKSGIKETRTLEVYIRQENGGMVFSCSDTCTLKITAMGEVLVDEKLEKDSASADTLWISLQRITRCLNREDDEIMKWVMYLTENDNIMPFEVNFRNINGEVDTILYQEITPYKERKASSTITGTCSPLESTISRYEATKKVKKWFFDNGKKLPAEQMPLLVGLYNELRRPPMEILMPRGLLTVPIVTSMKGLRYNVKSDIKADHYILYGCSREEEIKTFVGNIISDDFRGCVSSLSAPMECHTAMEACGYLCICLIAINDDWHYRAIPLAVVGLDTSAPERKSWSEPKYNQMNIGFGSNLQVLLPSLETECIYGYADVQLIDWDGNGIEVNCTFSIDFYGDVKYAVIHRRGPLTYPWHVSAEDKKIDLTGKSSPYIFTYTLHFENGDNIIPITIADINGHKTEYTIREKAKFVYRGGNDINIDNNINIDNY